MFGGAQSSSPSQGIRLTFITQSDQNKFESLFSRAVAGTGSSSLSADAARNILMRSQIDNNTLAQIWDLANVTNSPELTFPEFAVAMYLTSLKLTGKQVPSSLPGKIKDELDVAVATLQSTTPIPAKFQQSQPTGMNFQTPMMTGMQMQQPMMTGMPMQRPMNTGMPPMSTGMSMQQPMMTGAPMQPQQPMVTGLNRLRPVAPTAPPLLPLSVTSGRFGQNGNDKPRVQNNHFANMMMPTNNTNNFSGNHGIGVSGNGMSSEERQRYYDIFSAWDVTGSGFLDGNKARDIFAQAGLQQNELMKIWTLADYDDKGQLDIEEFAIAMHLIFRRMNGLDIPDKLPTELAPMSSTLKKFIVGGSQRQPSPVQSNQRGSPAARRNLDRRTSEEDGGYVSNARRKDNNRIRLGSSRYDDDFDEEDDDDTSELRNQIADLRGALDILNSSKKSAREPSGSSYIERKTVDDLKRKIKNVQDDLVHACEQDSSLSRYLLSMDEINRLQKEKADLETNINDMLDGEIPDLLRQVRGMDNEVRDLKARLARKRDGSENYEMYITPTGPGGRVTESDKIRAKAKAMMSARKLGGTQTSSTVDLREIDREKEENNAVVDNIEQGINDQRSALRLASDTSSFGSYMHNSDRKRFEQGEDISSDLKSFIEQLNTEAPLRRSSAYSSPKVDRYATDSYRSYNAPSPSTPSASLGAYSSSLTPGSRSPAPSRAKSPAEIKKEAERRVQERLAAFQRNKAPASPVVSQPAKEVPKEDPEQLAAQQRLREAEQRAKARLRERDEKRSEVSQPDAEKLAAEKREQERAEEERVRVEAERKREEEERLAQEKFREEEQQRAKALEEENRRVQQLEAEAEQARQQQQKDKEEQAQRALEQEREKQSQLQAEEAERAQAENDRRAEAERQAEAERRAEADRQAEQERQAAEQKAKEAAQPLEDESKPAAFSNNPYASQASNEQAEATSPSKKRESYNPFLMAKAPQEAPKITKEASDDDSDWEQVDENSSDDETEFPAAGSAKNLASLLFGAMGQKQTLPTDSPKASGASPSPLIPKGALSAEFGASPVIPSTENKAAAAPVTSSGGIPPPPPPPPMMNSAPGAEAGGIPPPPPPPPPPAPAGPGSSSIPPPPPAPPGPGSSNVPAAPPPPPVAAAPPPPPAPVSAPASTGSSLPQPDSGRSALLSQIQLGTKLRKANTHDRSQAAIAGHIQGEAPAPAPANPSNNDDVGSAPAPGFGGGGFLAELQARTGRLASGTAATQPKASEPVQTKSPEPAQPASPASNTVPMSPAAKLKALRRESTDWFGQMASQQLHPDPINKFESVAESQAEHEPSDQQESDLANEEDDRIDDYDLTKETRCSAVWGYDAQNPSDLSFAQDDVIISYALKSGEQPDWGYGMSELTGLKGFFPANYVEPIKDTEKLNIKVQALWDFDSNGSGLDFKAGDILTVTSKDMGDWWDAELEGRSGIIPSTFVEEI